ncbi:pH-response regulator protein palI/prr-5 [Colletotrichum fructicola]|nr:pH-response regulator protein palI/prr-5 [Colletotrichum fructicola]KAF4912332.1 pH-response regulator protein palI/prr-5 [Colletotrichum fructicola]KAF4934683.1 pH-response regulator protein palI/prr-5 [Colletotrichum fructicola]
MLRPATPMSLLLLAAFALMLLSTLSTPIIKAIPLGSFQGVNFGVFGVCKADGSCTGIEIGYDTSGLFQKSGAFDLPDSARNTLSAILIVHPIAALTTLIMFIMAAVAHLHSPSHSARYLLVVFIFSFIDFLICLLAFLVDVLLFVPHMAWGSYIVLAATILVGMSGLVSCAMRRMLVTRKARKKRIAENAEMSGENYYNREAQTKTATSVASQPTVPVVTGGNGIDKMPTFASFDSQKKDDQVSDERIPLTARSPVDRNQGNMMGVDGYANAPPSRSGSAPPINRDPYGNPMPGPDGYGPRRGPSQERMRGRGGMPPGGPRGRGGGYGGGRGGYNGYGPPPGRGGYGPPGRGGYGPPPGGRGGYGPPPRGGYGPGGMRGGRPPPPGYQNNAGPYDRRPSPANAYGAPAPGPYGRSGSESAPSYTATNTNPSLPSIPQQQGYEAYHPDRNSLPRAESPPPLPGDAPAPMVGQAVEMDARTGSPAQPPPGFGQFRDSDADIAGMVGLQQGGGNRSNPQRHDTYMSETSRYSQDDAYVPPRAAWNQNQPPSRNASPLSRAEMPGRSSPAQPTASDYYEDVDPRFADAPAPAPAAGRAGPPPALQVPLSVPNMYDLDTHEGAGARSPGAESDRSNFTSISQRGINPRWNPPAPYGQGPPRRPPQQRRQDMLLNNNPDFELPGKRLGPPSRPGGPGMISGSAYPTGL